MLVVGICEDDKIQRDLLIDKLEKIFENQSVEYKILIFSSGKDLIDNYTDEIDILLLDIVMPEVNGMQSAKILRDNNKNVEIIFITSEMKYVLKAYEVDAFRYILKPIDDEELERHLTACIKKLRNNDYKIPVRVKSQTVLVNIGSILYAEVMRKETTIFTEEGTFLTEMPLKKLETTIGLENFLRCHNSYLINLDKVDTLKKGYVVIRDVEIPISRNKVKVVKSELTKVLGKKV